MKDRLRELSWLVLILVVVVGCTGGGGKSSSPLPPRSDRSIDDFIARYVKLTKERDSQALAAMYTDPAEMVEMGVAQTLSRAELKDHFDAVFAVVSTVYDSQAKDVVVTVTGNSAVVEFTWFQDVENAFLGKRVKSEGHALWSLTRVGGEWYIARAESSPTVELDGIPFPAG